MISFSEHRLLAGAKRRVALAVLLACGACLLWAPAALAQAPVWSLTSQAVPTNFPLGDQTGGDSYFLIATNVGSAGTDGSAVTLTETLPGPLTVDTVNHGGPELYDPKEQAFLPCTTAGQAVTCTDPYVVPAGGLVQVVVPVDNSATAPETVTSTASVSGGGGASVSISQQTAISDATPAFGFLPGAGGLSAQITNADGSPDTQAGSHPYQLSVSFGFTTGFSGQDFPIEDPNDLTVNLPAGVVVNPNATPVKCTEAQLESSDIGGCPAESAVGTDMTDIGLLGTPGAGTTAVYNMVPPAGVPAELGFAISGLDLFEHVLGSVRTGGDYGLSATVNPIVQQATLLGGTVTLWGSPSDPSHDAERGNCRFSGGTCPVSPSSTPFLTMPSACSGPLTTTASMDSWQDPGTYVSASAHTTDGEGNPVGVSGCDKLDFTPSITVQPDTTVADSPGGLNVDLSVPQPQSQTGLAEANLKTAVVTLPAGVSVSPSAADGLQGCSEGQIGLDNANEPTCPDGSKIGSVEVTTPLLSDPLKGAVYLAQQGNDGAAQGSNPFGSLLAIYITAEADGALIKLAGHVVADPVTGQLETTFDNNPQLPFSDFKIDFFGGPRAPLATPDACGTYSTTSSLAPWSGTAPVVSSDPFTISTGCVNGFAPSFTAGTANPQAGSYSPFTLSFSRSDTDQNLSGLTVKLPPGLLAKLAGVPLCSDADAIAGTCPAASQVGTVEAGAGPGSSPFFLPGTAYLTGPYKGAPYGLAVEVPAIAGPFNLGTVVVRQALNVDPTTAQVTAVSDPFPTILQGIPLRIRRIDVNLNRPGFIVNPTSCDPMAITGALSSTGGLSAPVSSRFQVGGCQALSFSPKLNMKLTGKGRTRSGDHPNLISTLTQGSGQANIQNVKVVLPLSLALDPNNSQHVCNYDVAQAVHGGAVGCPASTIVGSASAVTPLLDRPLTGPVYLVQGIRFGKNGQRIRTLPSLLIPLRGQIALDLRAQSSVSHGKLVTTFPTIPDAAVSKFVLTISGGKRGIIVITGQGRTICGKPQVTDASFGAQSGKARGANVRMGTPCGHTKRKRHKKHGTLLPSPVADRPRS